MSKFIIEIKLADGNTKQVKVYVDNRTAELLNQCDARVRQTYLEEEYRMQNRERAETRKHISLETAIENGHDYISREDTPMDKLVNLEEKTELKLALDKLHITMSSDCSPETEFFFHLIISAMLYQVLNHLLNDWQSIKFILFSFLVLLILLIFLS